VERSSEIRRLRIGVIGCGLVAQVMHFPYLAELHERFEVVSLCDISPRALAFAGSLFPEARRHAGWEDVLADEPDAVMVLTPGSHAPIAVAAAQAGQHVFVEKPMCITLEEGREMQDAAAAAGVVLMVGYMKRYDPAYEELARVIGLEGVGFARITTLESPLEPYVAHYPLASSSDVEPALVEELAADDARRVAAALPDADDLTRRVYRAVLLDSMVHELNGVRGLLGEPTELHFARIRDGAAGVTASLSFGDVDCVFVWLDLPGIARYEQDWAFYGPEARATLRFPSPFLRSEPTQLVLEAGELGTASSWRTVQTVSYEEAFKRELVEFHEAVTEGRPPLTNGEDGLRDVLLCQAIARAHMSGLPLVAPTIETATA
jgi:predicted dehydrogenase